MSTEDEAVAALLTLKTHPTDIITLTIPMADFKRGVGLALNHTTFMDMDATALVMKAAAAGINVEIYESRADDYDLS
jgi:hypothetical protein